jgi:hypothetical protein
MASSVEEEFGLREGREVDPSVLIKLKVEGDHHGDPLVHPSEAARCSNNPVSLFPTLNTPGEVAHSFPRPTWNELKSRKPERELSFGDSPSESTWARRRGRKTSGRQQERREASERNATYQLLRSVNERKTSGLLRSILTEEGGSVQEISASSREEEEVEEAREAGGPLSRVGLKIATECGFVDRVTEASHPLK